MIGTIRKHQKWLWMVIVTITVLSFVVFFSPYSRMNNGGGGGGRAQDMGAIGGERISQEAFGNAQKETELRYFFSSGGHWPGDPNRRANFDPMREAYFWLLIIQKQEQFGIHVGADEVAQYARQMLAGFQKAGISSSDMFINQVLQPHGLTADDFERYVRHTLGLEELAAVIGLSGKLATPEEVKGLYVRENEEMSTSVVFFSASNHLAGVTVTPQQVLQYYSNNLANYKIPERVQVNYVKYPLTNYAAGAQAEMAKLTNLDEQVEMAYQKDPTNVLRDLKATSLADAKTKFREATLKNFEAKAADRDARDFANKLFDQTPMQAENIGSLAKAKGLTVQTTTPFDEDGPKDMNVTASFARAAFGLSKEEPFGGPILGEDGLYVIGIADRFPSEIPPLEKIHDQVTADLKNYIAVGTARQEGMGFYQTLTNGLARKSGFSAIAMAAKLKPIDLPPFALSTRTLPEELQDRLTLDHLKQLAFSTRPGEASEFMPTVDGGVILYVRSRLPVDEAKMQSQLPAYIAYVRTQRQKEAFDQWFNHEAQHDLRNIPYFQQKQTPAMSSRKG
jgi:peptidyl-prolyl cis-trans isomerase D